MAIPITIPRLGWNMDEGVFAGWLKQDGESIRAGDALFSLESEKATEEIECLDSGTLRIPPDGPQTGDKLRVGTVIGYLVEPGEAPPFDARKETVRAAAAKPVLAEAAAAATSPSVRRLAREHDVDLEQVAGTGADGRITAEDVQRFAQQRGQISEMPTLARDVAKRGAPTSSPRARRVARELGVDWTRLQGSGRTGRIREKDVRAATTTRRSPFTHSIPVSPIRRTIAERMLASVRATAPVTLTTTADATNLVNLRNQFKAVAQTANEPVPSYTDFLVKLTAVALQAHPMLNSRRTDEQIIVLPEIHIAVAVDTDAGLLAPVIRNVPQLTLRQVAEQARDLAERARQRKLKAEEMQDGTFTLTNLGAFGIDAFTPIINYPQCAVLGVGRIERRPVVVSEQIVPRDQITLSLTFDHRIVDGAPAARFLQAVARLIENPGPSLMP